MPVRKVRSSGRNVIGKFPSLKMGCMVLFESLVELDFIYLLDYEQAVERFEEQPLTIEYEYDGELLRYTPDFHVVYLGCNWLVECKPEKFVDTDENHRKFVAAANRCDEWDWQFVIATAEELRAGFRLRNVKLLTRYARHPVDPITRSRVYARLLVGRMSLTVLDLARYLAPHNPPEAFPVVFHMAYRHELAIPIDDAAISPDSPVSLPAPPILEGGIQQ